MSFLRKVMEHVARIMPDKAPDPLLDKRDGYVGTPLRRVDGLAKVTGEARFTGDVALDDMVHAVLVHSTITRGRILAIDTSLAEAAPGFVGLVTHLNAPKLDAPHLINLFNTKIGFAASDLPTMQDDRVHWDGQAVAVLVARSLEEAEHAASLVRVTYEQEEARTSFEALRATATEPKEIVGEPPEISIGNAEAALASADIVVDATYGTPWENHNAIEPHATVAAWDGDDSVVVYESTQFVNGYKHLLAEVFRLDPDAVGVLAGFVGGGFGGKVAFWTNTILCVATAKVIGRPVKLVLSRESVYRIVGGRSLTEQRVRLGATREGKLTALSHTALTVTLEHARYAEQCTFPPRHLYGVENLYVGQHVVALDVVPNTWMRAPGESVGTFALESAIDELAYALDMDPIALRTLNEPDEDPTKHTPFSSRELVRAYTLGAERFGWTNDRRVRARRDGKWLVGHGVATAYYPVYRFPAKVRLRLSADGDVLVQSVANEIGGGAATVQMQHVADRLQVPIGSVRFQYGDSKMPDSGIEAGGSSQTISIASAIAAAVDKARRDLHKLADDHDCRGESVAVVLTRAGMGELEVDGTSPQRWRS